MVPETREPYRLLLFEDSPDDERIALRALRACGVEVSVQVARDGEEALTALGLREQVPVSEEKLPDLVISDLKMPKLRGDEVLAQMRQDERLSDLPFVMFSSSDEPSDISRCMSLGATAYCVKPVDYTDYSSCLAGILKAWLLGKEEDEPDCTLAT